MSERPQITRADARRVIKERLTLERDRDDDNPLEEFLARHNVEEGVIDDVIGSAMRSGRTFFLVMMDRKVEEVVDAIEGEFGVAEIGGDEMERLVGEVCAAVAASFFMLGWEVCEQLGPRS